MDNPLIGTKKLFKQAEPALPVASTVCIRNSRSDLIAWTRAVVGLIGSSTRRELCYAPDQSGSRSKMPQPANWYDSHVDEASRSYESVSANDVHDWLVDLLPNAPALVLDVGAGSGRDAAWLASRGLEVVAAEPSAAMLSRAQSRHTSPSIRWLCDSLPSLEKVLRLGLSFDLILLSAVWMHVAPTDRARAFRKLVTLLKPGGCIAITLRHGPSEPERAMFDVSQSEVEQLARIHGAFVERVSNSKDKHGRLAISWTQLAIRLPDDGTGALPLLRHIILNDSKSSTYKLALLRVLCRIADGSSGYARDCDDDHVAVPLGLVGLYWVRLFKPLLADNLPQSPANKGDAGLGFVKTGFRSLSGVSQLDLRIGTRFEGERAIALHSALSDACKTISNMPARYTTYPNGSPVLPVKRRWIGSRPDAVQLAESYLLKFGDLLIPRHLWRALQRFDAWIEPALIAEWSRLMIGYANSQNRKLSDAVVTKALSWSEPNRDARTAREQAARLMANGRLHCVWSGRLLSQGTLDIDHCFPWAAWPCDDLWNLLPVHRDINQKKKREKLPGVKILQRARDRIQSWWDDGYVRSKDQVLRYRFFTEAKATLPAMERQGGSVDEVFAALQIQQVRLKDDQQIPVWEP